MKNKLIIEEIKTTREKWQVARKNKLKCKYNLLENGIKIEEIRKNTNYKNYKKLQKSLFRKIKSLEKVLNRKRSSSA